MAPVVGRNRPNVLFALADDASHMSAYGHRFVRTPSFDRVAKDGVLFTNAFTTNPKCAPSRASILTGLHTWQLEDACCHYGLFPARFTVFPDVLESTGYHIGFTGKGWAPGDWERSGRPRNPAGPEFSSVRLSPPSPTISDIDYAGNFHDFLLKRPAGAPFCFWYGGKEPHRRYDPGEGVRGGKRLEDVSVPSYWPDEESVRSDVLDYAFETEWFDRHLGLMLEELDRIGELSRTLVIVTSDNGMPFPRVKGQMYEHDFRLPLAVMFRSAAPSGRVVDDLVSFIDFAPTILEAAGIELPRKFQGRSLLPILCDTRSGRIEAHIRDYVYMGRERHDLGREGDRGYPVRCIRDYDYLYIRNFAADRWPAGNPETGFTNTDSSPTKSRILELHDEGEDYYYDLNFGKRPTEELFDIRTDQECLKNLAEDPHFSGRRKAMWEKLKAKLEETEDPRILGRGDVFDTYEYVGKGKHSWKCYLDGTFEPQKY